MDIFIAAVIGAGATLGATILSYWLKINHEKSNKHLLLKDHVDQNENIYEALDCVVEKFKCDRAHIFEFHNGDTYYSGSSQQKFSSTYEVVGDGISSEGSVLQNLRISSFNTLIKDVINHGCFMCEDINDIETEAEKCHLKRQGVKSVYSFSIKTLTGKIIGVFSIDYVLSRKKMKEEDIVFLKNQAKILSGYLSND